MGSDQNIQRHILLYNYLITASATNLKTKHLTADIVCDVSKAFDVINHKILVNKLEHHGIRGIAKTWMVNYLTNKK